MSQPLKSRYLATKHRLASTLKGRFGVQPLHTAQNDLEQWLDSPLGQRLLTEEHRCIERSLRCLFGYHLMQLSISRKLDLCCDSPINHRFQLNVQPFGESDLSGCVANFEQLPLSSDSIDVCLLHHVLEFSTNPHQLLREASRAIIPHGYLLIVGFNPWSLYGACRPLAGLVSRSAQWRYNSLRLGRLFDWLRLLDFEPMAVEKGYYGLPFGQRPSPWMDNLGRSFLSGCGAFYVVSARKQVMPVTPVKPKWQATLPEWAPGRARSKASTKIPVAARTQKKSR